MALLLFPQKDPTQACPVFGPIWVKALIGASQWFFLLKCNIRVVFSPSKLLHMPAKVKKVKARPKRTILAKDDHPVGLWIDKELIRKHTQQQTPRTIIHGSSEAAGNRYLELADIALGNPKNNKKKTNGKASYSNGKTNL